MQNENIIKLRLCHSMVVLWWFSSLPLASRVSSFSYSCQN